MCNAATVLPGPVGTSEAVWWLMLTNTLDQGVACGFVVTALDVKVTEERLEDEGYDDCNPGFEKIDESSVGAELLQDVDWKLALKVPSHSGRRWER